MESGSKADRMLRTRTRLKRNTALRAKKSGVLTIMLSEQGLFLTRGCRSSRTWFERMCMCFDPTDGPGLVLGTYPRLLYPRIRDNLIKSSAFLRIKL